MDYLVYAKSFPKETLEEHTEKLIELLKGVKFLYPHLLAPEEWEWLYLAVYYHDFGKINIKFQNKIRKVLHETLLLDLSEDIEEISHNYLSPAFLDKSSIVEMYGEMAYEIIVKAIYYHHARVRQSPADIKEMSGYIKEQMGTGTWSINIDQKMVSHSLTDEYIFYIQFDEDEEGYTEFLKKYILVKGLLNRLDYAASAGLTCLEEELVDEFGDGLTEKMQSYMDKRTFTLRESQRYMMEHQSDNPILIASTGTGKTEAALLWIGNRKAFYTLPLKVSINAIYDRVKFEIGYKKSKLLHSDAFSVYLEETQSDVSHQYSMAKLLATPLTLCTIDQLFKFVYRYNGGEVPLATLSYSKLVIDEIQMYSPRLVSILIAGLKMIVDLGGQFAIITATFPHVLYRLMDKAGIKYQLPQKVFHGNIGARHRIRLLEEKTFDYQKIADFASQKRVLVICNTVRHAQQVYEELRNWEDRFEVNLLHSSYLKRDRKQLEQNILGFAPNKESREQRNGIWVSTQIVEASLDIDFDYLFTEMCSIDSLLQRMGRDYRGRQYDMGDTPNVYILDNRNIGNGWVVDEELYDFSLHAVKRFDGMLLQEHDMQDDKQEMMDDVFHEERNPKILRSKYYREINSNIGDLSWLKMYDCEKKTADKIFRDIDSKTVMPISVYQKLEDGGIAGRWKEIMADRSLDFVQRQRVKEEIESYTVSLSNYYGLDIAPEELFYHGSRIYLYRGPYDFEDGKGVGLIKKYKTGEKEVDIFL